MIHHGVALEVLETTVETWKDPTEGLERAMWSERQASKIPPLVPSAGRQKKSAKATPRVSMTNADETKASFVSERQTMEGDTEETTLRSTLCPAVEASNVPKNNIMVLIHMRYARGIGETGVYTGDVRSQ